MEASNLQPHVPTLGVSVEAVREQLLLLGHTIPDHVIKAFLDNGLPGLRDAPLHIAPEAHAASVTGTGTHASDDAAPAVLPACSMRLSAPHGHSVATPARESDPVHWLHSGTTGTSPPHGATKGIAAPAPSCCAAQQIDEQLCIALDTAPAAQGVAVQNHAQASASGSYERLQECLPLSAVPTDPCAAASSPLCHLSASLAGLQIKTGPAPERSHALHPSDTPLSSVREHIIASQAPAVVGDSAESTHDHAASAQPAGRMRSDVPDQAPAALPRSWRQLISQPLYPERLPAACQGRGVASSGPGPTHARKQDYIPSSLGGDYPHCSASPRQEVRGSSGRSAVKSKAWSADLYRGLSDVPGSSTAAPQASISHDAPPLQEGSARASGTQHAKRAESAPHRSQASLRQASTKRTAQAAPGKENDKQQLQPQAQHRHAAEQLQKRPGHQGTAPSAKAIKHEMPPYGSPRSVQTSGPFTPRLGARGPKRLDRVARFRQMQAIWAGDAFLKSGAAGANGAGKRKKLGFCKAFADVHAANERMHNFFVDWSAANC